jgi:hypothetical protein
MTSLRCRRKRLDVLLHESPSPLARQVALDRISPRPLQSNLRMLIPLAHQPSAPSIVSDKTIHQEKQSLRPSQLSSTPVPTSTSSASASPSDAPRPPSLLLRVFYALLLFPLLYAIHQLVVQPVGLLSLPVNQRQRAYTGWARGKSRRARLSLGSSLVCPAARIVRAARLFFPGRSTARRF